MALLTAGFLCKHGLLSLKMVMLTAFVGTLLFEQCMFFVGRVYGARLLKKYPSLSEKADKVIEFLHKYDSVFIFSFRFVYGIRNISPIIIGLAGIRPLKFSLLNIPAAFIWAISVAGAGYKFADFLEAAKNDIYYLQICALVVFVCLLLYFLYHRRKKQKEAKKTSTD